MALPAGVYITGSGVDKEADAAEGALSFEAGDDVVGDFNVLGGTGQDELARMEDEWIIFGDLFHFGEVGGVLANVDEGFTGIAEDKDLVVEVDVDAGGLDI